MKPVNKTLYNSNKKKGEPNNITNGIYISHIQTTAMNIFCRHSVFISLAGFVGRFLFGLRMFMDIQKCVYFEPLQLHSTMLTLFICDFVVRRNSLWRRFRFAWNSFGHYFESQALFAMMQPTPSHITTQRMFSSIETNEAFAWMCTALRRRYIRIACKYATMDVIRIGMSIQRTSKTFDGWHFMLCAHMLTTIFASFSISFVRHMLHGAV